MTRQANKLRHSSPFAQRRADTLEQQARDHRVAEMAGVVDVLEAYGRVLVLDREGYAKALADLLNITRTDRARSLQKGSFYLTDLVAIEGLENSAERRGDFTHLLLRTRATH